MIRLPNPTWKQINNSDKFGNVFYTKNINFDEEGYAKLSPRMVKIYDENENNDFGLPIAISRVSNGEYMVATTEENFRIVTAASSKSATEDTGINDPDYTEDGHATFFQGLWHASTSTTVVSRPITGGAGQTWTSRVTGLTSGKQHYLTPFDSRSSLCVSNGNVVKQYDTSYSNTVDLTIPTDFEIVGMAYNNETLGIITRLNNDGSFGQDREAQFFTWNGATTGAQKSFNVGSDAAIGIVAYKSSFLILTRAGELLYFNGGGFQQMAAFPFYFTEDIFGDPQDNNILGNVYMKVDGDVVYINLGVELDPYGAKEEQRPENVPSGIWCFDPKVGLYHRWSPSISPYYVNSVTSGNVNTSTNVMTTSGTLPPTGNPVILTNSAGIGGLVENKIYYLITLSSTTFSLATTKELAEVGEAIDLTSATAGTSFFHMFDLIDYGQTYYQSSGGLTKTANRSNAYTDIVAGARLYGTDGETFDLASGGFPFLENRGYIVTPKLFSQNATTTHQKVFIKYRPLSPDDTIVVKARFEDYYGLPTATPNDQLTWTGKESGYTNHDLSEAKAYLDLGKELEAEFVSGAGAGQCVQVESIDYGSGVYSLVFKEDVLGAASSNMSDFVLHNWHEVCTITSQDDGLKELTMDIPATKFLQLKIELRGYDIAIEFIDIVEVTNQPNV